MSKESKKRVSKPIKQKKCRSCLGLFTPSLSTQIVCSPRCAYLYASGKEEKKFKKETRRRKIEANQNDRKWWIEKAKTICHKYIRMRDADRSCVCCPDVFHSSKWDAGHYIPAGRCSALRFDERNIHKQRSRPCNKDMSGNLTAYRAELIKRIGIDTVEWLEGPQPNKKWTIDELKEIVSYYQKKVKLLDDIR